MTKKQYEKFLKSKRLVVEFSGKDVRADDINPLLFPFQRDLVAWACRKGRAAIFADTGLGKTFMQLEWARTIGERTLIVAPLSVARQTIREAAKLGIEVVYSRDGSLTGQFTITNYEMIEHFDPSEINAVILDESSILKSLDGKTRKMLIEMFKSTPYRLCCTATPAPNDIAELGNHSEFLGWLTHKDMLVTFFKHGGDKKGNILNVNDGWTLKPYARRPFFQWLASWGMSIRKPSDLGYDNDGYNLPPLNIEAEWLDFEYVPAGQLFNTGLKGIGDRIKVRRETISARAIKAAELINGSGETWIAWVGLNDEDNALSALIPDAVSLTGSQSPEEKAKTIEAFQDGEFRVLITKPSIAGFGINLQNCHNQVFVGLNDSYETYYQAVRRSYRFGQTNPVNVHIVLTNLEAPILENVWAKEKEAKAMSDELIKEVVADEMAELGKKPMEVFTYRTDDHISERYHLMLGDSVERMAEIASESIATSVFSPPFSGLYAYTADARDLGNTKGGEEFFAHFQFIINELYRITMPGRNACVHIMQSPATLSFDGFMGLKDFHGDVIRAFVEAGWLFFGEAIIDKNPQAQAIRTKQHHLLFKTLNKDSARIAPGLPDYLLIFKKPGENLVPITPVANGEMTNEDWISWAHPLWSDISETEVLNVRNVKRKDGEKHIAPLQLEVIRRAVIMYSNPDELVFDPFGGIGSTGYVAVENGRRALMCELKPEYFEVMKMNMAEAAQEGRYQLRMFEDDMFTMPIEQEVEQ